jgi:hypothetical protein
MKDQLLDVGFSPSNVSALHVLESTIYGHIDKSVFLSFSCLGFTLLIYLVQVVLLSLPVMPRVVTSEWSRLDGWTRAERSHRR